MLYSEKSKHLDSLRPSGPKFRSGSLNGTFSYKLGRHHTSTVPNFYTALKFGSKTQFYGRVALDGILAITYENGPFYGRGAAEAIFWSSFLDGVMSRWRTR